MIFLSPKRSILRIRHYRQNVIKIKTQTLMSHLLKKSSSRYISSWTRNHSRTTITKCTSYREISCKPFITTCKPDISWDGNNWRQLWTTGRSDKYQRGHVYKEFSAINELSTQWPHGPGNKNIQIELTQPQSFLFVISIYWTVPAKYLGYVLLLILIFHSQNLFLWA